jgi:lipid II:glycine glycyltransferase (peptidoglycan interpeptide bridge formation enzyme)
MLDAKESGQELFDMWGVSPEDEPDHQWAGFSRFKRSFGGFEVEYPGTWDLPVNKVLHAAYTAARGLRDGLRRGAPAARKAKDAVGSALGAVKGKLRR